MARLQILVAVITTTLICALFGGAAHYDSAILSLTLGESCAFEPYELYREADEIVEIRWRHGGHTDARIEGKRRLNWNERGPAGAGWTA